MRLASSLDSFSSSYKWKDKLEFIVDVRPEFMMTWTSLLPDLTPEYAKALVDLVGSRYIISPQFYELKKLCPQMLFYNDAAEWVFFAGTFNPWHRGHQACLNLIPDEKVCFIAPDRNPHKELRQLDSVSCILEISSNAKFKKSHFLIPSFLTEERKNPTVDWIERVRSGLPDKQISLLMGFDSFASLKTWTRVEDLLPLLNTLYVVSRQEDEEEQELALNELQGVAPSLKVEFLGKHPYEELSSSKLRQN